MLRLPGTPNKINNAFPLVDFYFVAGTGHMSNAHEKTVKICVPCPLDLTHNFNPV